MGHVFRHLCKPKIGWQIYAWSTLLLCLYGSGCDKQNTSQVDQTDYQIEKKYDNDTIDFTLKIEKPQLAISDTLYIQLQAIADENIEVTLPSVAQQLGEYDFNVIESQSTGPKLLDDHRIIYQDTYHLEPVLPGNRELPALEITYEVDGKSKKLTTDPIFIEITSPFDSSNIEDQQLADIKPLVKVRFKYQYLWLWLTVLALILIIIAVILTRRYRKKKQLTKRVYKAAHQLAFERLEDLENKNLINQGLFKPFYEEISSILRGYIEDRFQLQAPERTTEEFLQEAHDSDALNDQHTEKLKIVLVHSDQVKFARYTPSKDEVNHSVERVKDFIESTINENYQVDVTPTDSVGPSVLQGSKN